MDKPNIADSLRMDPNDLYREEVFTDRRSGTLRRLTPVTPDGADDDRRSVRYVGNTQILTALGTLPITFEVEADSLGEAAEKFAATAEKAVEDTMRELEDMRRDAASRIVVPEAGGAGGLGGAGGPGGGIQIP